MQFAEPLGLAYNACGCDGECGNHSRPARLGVYDDRAGGQKEPLLQRLEEFTQKYRSFLGRIGTPQIEYYVITSRNGELNEEWVGKSGGSDGWGEGGWAMLTAELRRSFSPRMPRSVTMRAGGPNGLINLLRSRLSSWCSAPSSFPAAAPFAI